LDLVGDSPFGYSIESEVPSASEHPFGFRAFDELS
jgi:hypothetical protein